MKARNVWTSVIVSNMVEAVKFYTEKLGFKPPEKFDPNSSYIILEAPGGLIVLKSVTWVQAEYQKPGDCKSLSIGIAVDDVEDDMKELQSKGVIFDPPHVVKSEPNTFAFFTDPDKNPLYLVSGPLSESQIV